MKQFKELTNEEKQPYLDLVVNLLKEKYPLCDKELVSCKAEMIYNFFEHKKTFDISKEKNFAERLTLHSVYCWCPSCRYTGVLVADDYCSNCGVKLNWIK